MKILVNISLLLILFSCGGHNSKEEQITPLEISENQIEETIALDGMNIIQFRNEIKRVFPVISTKKQGVQLLDSHFEILCETFCSVKKRNKN